MVKNILIGILVLSIICAILDACLGFVRNTYDAIFSTHEEVMEAIDKGKLSEAKKLLPDVKEDELYKCALLLIEEYIAIKDVDNAIYVFDRITPHCNMYHMQYSYEETGDYTKKASSLIYEALLDHEEYEKAWNYHKLDYGDPDYAGNGLCYYNYMLDVMEHQCKNGDVEGARLFLNDHVVWFRRNVDGTNSHPEYESQLMKTKLQSALDSFKVGGVE